MRSTFEIGEVRIHAALAEDRAKGLRCFASCTIGAWTIDGLVVRRSSEGAYFVKWPSRIDSNGNEHIVVQPSDQQIRPAIRLAVNRAVLAKARAGGWIE
jgi:DNA-binding cell septation regulator SpoVG